MYKIITQAHVSGLNTNLVTNENTMIQIKEV
jgi:hypothetical protein